MFKTKLSLARTTSCIEFLESETDGYLYCHMIQDYPKPLSAIAIINSQANLTYKRGESLSR